MREGGSGCCQYFRTYIHTYIVSAVLGWPTLFSSPSLIDSEAASWHRFDSNNASDNALYNEDDASALSSATALRYLLHSIRPSTSTVKNVVHHAMQSVQAVSTSSSILFVGANSLYALPLVMQLLRKVTHNCIHTHPYHKCITYIHAYIHTYVYMHIIHTCIHTYIRIHTYIHTCIHT